MSIPTIGGGSDLEVSLVCDTICDSSENLIRNGKPQYLKRIRIVVNKSKFVSVQKYIDRLRLEIRKSSTPKTTTSVCSLSTNLNFSTSNQSSTITMISTPKEWTPMSENCRYSKVLVTECDPEYFTVTHLFKASNRIKFF